MAVEGLLKIVNDINLKRFNFAHRCRLQKFIYSNALENLSSSSTAMKMPLRDQIFSSLRQGGNASPVFLPTMIAAPGMWSNEGGFGDWVLAILIVLLVLAILLWRRMSKVR